MVKTCDRGLENAARNRMSIFFSCSKLVLQPITNGFVYTVARRLLTICKKSSQRASDSDTSQEKMY